MSINSSSNDSVPPTSLPSSSSSFPCLLHPQTSSVFIAYTLANILLLFPLYLFVLYHGLQQWWRRRSSSSSPSSSDLFALHMAAVELVGVSGCFVWCSGISRRDGNQLWAGYLLLSFTWFGQNFFHLMTCVERYLAVVHPVTYRGLRTGRGLLVRNVVIGCVWLLCLAGTTMVLTKSFAVLDITFLLFCLVVIAFCSLLVLRVLLRPGPGEQGNRVDQSKRRAFCTITAILGVLVLRFLWNLVWGLETLLGKRRSCLVEAAEIWFNLPSSLVLPVLFLHRRGKLACT